ncbi:hypothetical protein LZC95_45370 [Pendulispora brunnea]|uniref:Tryptophan synthase alpha chain n=1 Tax=Pendulispora brunnea TaxID=2905690 RepID=A0ABZ2K4R7_9BACT
MNTMRLAAALGIATLAASAGFLACSNDDSSAPQQDASTDGKLDTGALPDTGGNTQDAGTDAQQPISDPGLVACGSSSCNTASQYCCIRPDGGVQSCNDTTGGGGRDGGGGGTCANGTRIECDEAADCNDAGASGLVCCVRLASGIVNEVGNRCQTTAQCQRAASGVGRHACKTDSDCADAGADARTCVTQGCRGRSVRSCGGFPVDDAGIVMGCN